MRFDATWIQNRFRQRKGLTGTRQTKDPVTGYLEPVGRKGFTAANRHIFIERMKICSSVAGVARSIPIDVQSVYDATAVDTKFREEMNVCWELEGRAVKLNTAIEQIEAVAKDDIIADLAKKMERYEH